jgi:hypothetical protein
MSQEPPTVPSIVTSISPKEKTLYHRAATFCLWSPFISIVLHILMIPGEVAHPPQTRIDAAVSAAYEAIVPVSGIIAGVISLFGICRHGTAAILWKTVIGLSIFVLMVLLATHDFLKAKEIARQRYEQQYGHPRP